MSKSNRAALQQTKPAIMPTFAPFNCPTLHRRVDNNHEEEQAQSTWADPALGHDFGQVRVQRQIEGQEEEEETLQTKRLSNAITPNQCDSCPLSTGNRHRMKVYQSSRTMTMLFWRKPSSAKYHTLGVLSPPRREVSDR